MKSTSRNHGAPFKAPAAMKGDKTLAEWAEPCHVPPPQITEWKPQRRVRAADVLGGTHPTPDPPARPTLQATIGQLTEAGAIPCS
ncbi:MAG TPA: hypothetical protein VK901_20505 [Nitrospiraceae bacterium]|nr:hypothetical protein [Nitrospiraceae bacterium]